MQQTKRGGFAGESSHLHPGPLRGRPFLTHLSLHPTGISSPYCSLALLPPMFSLLSTDQGLPSPPLDVPMDVGPRYELLPGLLLAGLCPPRSLSCPLQGSGYHLPQWPTRVPLQTCPCRIRADSSFTCLHILCSHCVRFCLGFFSCQGKQGHFSPSLCF